MDGPVVADAKSALAKGDVTPVLKWVQKDGEPEIQAAFQKTLAVRKQSPQAKELADRFFFETLVRIHRAGEGAPYTGLKPAGTPLEPGVAGADKALDTGSVEDLVKDVTKVVADGVRQRFAKAAAAKKRADDNVEAGREFVEAYIGFVHYVEQLHETVKESSHASSEVSAHEHSQKD